MTDRSDADACAEAFAACSNAGRWGPDDELGTLNLITPEKRRRAAALVTEGVTVSLARDLDETQSAVNPRPVWHQMIHESERPYATADTLALLVHGLAETHLDALAHMFFDGVGYNRSRQSDVVGNGGLARNSISAQRDGIFTRGVLLDVARARDVAWLSTDDVVGRDDLRRATELAGVELEPGDAVIVHVGLGRREAAEGREDPAVRAGLDLDAVRWLHEQDVAVYGGDCIEKLPSQHERMPLPLHQLALAAMGMPLLHNLALGDLIDACARSERAAFLLTLAPLRVRRGTGSPVNPLAVL